MPTERVRALLVNARHEFNRAGGPVVDQNSWREIGPALDGYLTAIDAGAKDGLDADQLGGCQVAVAAWALELTQRVVPHLVALGERALDRAGRDAVRVAAHGRVITGGPSKGQFTNPFTIPPRFQ